MDADPGTVYLPGTAKGRLAKDHPGYRISDAGSFPGGVLAALRGGGPPSPPDVRAVTFPLTRWRAGYALRDVDRLTGELAQLVWRPGPDADAPLAVRKLAGRVGNSRLGTARWGGYAEGEAGEFLGRIIHDLMRVNAERCSGWPARPGSRR